MACFERSIRGVPTALYTWDASSESFHHHGFSALSATLETKLTHMSKLMDYLNGEKRELRSHVANNHGRHQHTRR